MSAGGNKYPIDFLAYEPFDYAYKYRSSRCNPYKNYLCTLWLKFTEKPKKDTPSITLKITSKSKEGFTAKETSDSVKVPVDGTVVGGWQQVKFPICIEYPYIANTELFFDGFNAFKLADMRMSYSTKSYIELMIAADTFVPLGRFDEISITFPGDKKSKSFPVDKDNYLSAEDLQTNLLEYIKAQNNKESTFLCSLCDGTKRFLVNDIVLNVSGMDKVSCSLASLTDGFAQFRQYIESTDGKISIIESIKKESLNGFGGIRLTTTATKGDKSSSSSVFVSLTGLTLQEVDEYGVTTNYAYDGNGILCKKEVVASDGSETIAYRVTNNENNTEETDTVTFSADTSYDEFGNPAVFTDKKADGTDPFKTSVTYGNNGKDPFLITDDAGGNKHFAYNSRGWLEEVSTDFSADTPYGYRFTYDDFGNLSKTYLLRGKDKTVTLLTEKNIDYAAGTVTDKRYRNINSPDETTVTLDKYGRTKKIVEKSAGDTSSYTTTFTYQHEDAAEKPSAWESDGSSEVCETYDPYENRTYRYSFDDFNRCTKVSSDDFISIYKSSDEKTDYLFENQMSFSSEINKDDDVICSPRTKRTVSFYAPISETYPLLDEITYEYDPLGRLSKKTVITAKDTRLQKNEIFYEETQYLKGTTLKSRICYKKANNDSELFKIDHGYDSRGRVLSNVYSDHSDNQGFNHYYTYDNANRLTRETFGKKTTDYTYTADGMLATETTSSNKITHTYRDGRLVIFKDDGVNYQFDYDNLGNCTRYKKRSIIKDQNLFWERGSMLKKYTDKNAEYFYNAKGLRFKKKVGDKETEYCFDGDKVISEKTGRNTIYYLYDINGIIGFSYQGYPYNYVKDGQGNIIAILKDNNIVVSYDYDAWGNCSIVKDTDGIGAINPIRWKSQYYDTESGFYFIAGRYYSPSIKQFLSPANPETALANTLSVYGLNLYSLCLTNPVDLAYNEYTIESGIDLTYDPPKLSAWDLFWRRPIAKVLAVALFAIAAVIAVFTGNVPIFIKMTLGVLGSLLIGATVAGLHARENGDPFWQSFGNYLNDNWSQTLAVSMAVFIVICGVSLAYHAYFTPNEEHAAKTITESGVEIQKATKGNFTSEAWDEIQSLPRDANGNTVSNLKSGKKIHHGFMTKYAGKGKEFSIPNVGRADAVIGNTIYELKPNNPISISKGIHQLQRYNNGLGGAYIMILIVY